jgi:hypothetical protein
MGFPVQIGQYFDGLIQRKQDKFNSGPDQNKARIYSLELSITKGRKERGLYAQMLYTD